MVQGRVQLSEGGRGELRELLAVESLFHDALPALAGSWRPRLRVAPYAVKSSNRAIVYACEVLCFSSRTVVAQGRADVVSVFESGLLPDRIGAERKEYRTERGAWKEQRSRREELESHAAATRQAGGSKPRCCMQKMSKFQCSCLTCCHCCLLIYFQFLVGIFTVSAQRRSTTKTSVKA